MAVIKSITYERGFIPDNVEPAKDLKKYENEKFGVVLEPDQNKPESENELFDLAEQITLRQHERAEEKRDARRDVNSYHHELRDIEEQLRHIDTNMMDENKLLTRKRELQDIIKSVG